MSYTNNPYCELSDVRLALGLRSVADDAWITSMIPQAQALIDGELGYSFQSEGTHASPVSRSFSGGDRSALFTGWIQEVTQVVEVNYAIAVGWDGLYNITSSTTQDITQDIWIGPENRAPGWQLERKSELLFNAGRRNYTVTGVWGFTDIPPDITRACARIVVHWFKMRDTNYADTLAEQGNIRQKYTKDLPIDVVQILDNHRLRIFFTR